MRDLGASRSSLGSARFAPRLSRRLRSLARHSRASRSRASDAVIPREHAMRAADLTRRSRTSQAGRSSRRAQQIVGRGARRRVTVSPASMRAISSRRARRPARRPASPRRPRAVAFATRRCAAPRAATCGLCVTTSTCTPLGDARQPLADRRRRRAADAASTSSNTSVGAADPPTAPPSAPASAATIRRPRRSRASGPGSCPGLVAIRKRTWSAPCAPHSASASAVTSATKPRLVQPQRRQLLRHRALQPRRGGAPRRRQRVPRPRHTRRARRRGRLLQRRHLGRAGLQRRQPRASVSSSAGSSATVTACLRAAARSANSRSSACSSSRGSASASAASRVSSVSASASASSARSSAASAGGRPRLRPPRAAPAPPAAAAPARRRATPPPGRDRGDRAPSRRRQLRQRGGDRLGPPLALLQPLALGRQPRPPRPRRGASVASSSTACRSHSSSRSAASIRSRAAASAASASRQSRHAARHRLAQRRRHAERVQQRAVARRIGQPHLLVLALHLDQQRAGAPQQRHAHRLVVEEGARPAVARPARGAARSRPPPPAPARPAAPRSDAPAGGAKHAVTLACSAPARTSPASARAPSARPRLSSRIDLPAPVSPVSTVSPGAERQVEPLDQHHVADRQRGEHADRPASASIRKSNARRARRSPAPVLTSLGTGMPCTRWSREQLVVAVRVPPLPG